jgi:hypothetical protein
MAEQAPRWIDAPEFQWTPERPFRVEPEFRNAPLPANDDLADARLKPGAVRKAAPSYLVSRLIIGLAQGLGLLLLPPAASTVSASLFMLLLFAPLALLAGLGRVPGKLLLPWTLIAGLALAALGAYQHWRGPGIAGVIAMAGLFLFIAQAMITAWAQSGQPLASYSAYHDSAWRLALQCLLCGFAAAASFVLADSGFALLRQSYPAAHPAFLITPIVTLSVAMTSWLAAPGALRPLQKGVTLLLTLTLPLMVLLAAAAGVAGALLRWQPPLLLSLALGFMLLVCLNASYGDGGERPRWRQALEFMGAFALVAPVTLGVFALMARTGQAGWTSARILAASALWVLAGYALLYGAAALIALGGGGWMKRIERANIVMAIMVLGLLAALLSPIADPARLAVASQMQRLDGGKVAADDFDFAWLAVRGGAFGHQALQQIVARKTRPDQARGAFLALVTRPDAMRPAPTEIGANIEVRGGVGRLPSSLLARDWSRVTSPGVPPCLTKPALPCDAYFVDLDGDGRDEIVLVYGDDRAWWGGVMKEGAAGEWNVAGTLSAPACRGSLDALRAGRFAPVDPLPGWRDLLVGGVRLGVVANAKPANCS